MLSEQSKSNITKIAIDTTFISTNTRSAAELEVSHSLMTHKVFQHHGADCRIIPATFDSFGRLGPTITDFLFGPNNAYKSFERHTNNLSPAAQQAIANTTEKHRIHSLLPRANKDWKLKHGEVAWYTPSYKAKTPSMWAKQYLSINMINAIGRHIEQGIGKSLYQTKNASILNTAGTRQDYFSHKYTPTTNNFYTHQRHDDAATPPHHHTQQRQTPSTKHQDTTGAKHPKPRS